MRRLFLALIAVVLLLSGMPTAAAPSAQNGDIVVDGFKEAAWGEPLASDPAGDISEPNLDLQQLYVVEDANNIYVGFDAIASTYGMTYGLYVDTDQADGSGATSDPWGRAVNAVSAHLPEHTLYVWHEETDTLQDAQINHWDGSGWSYDTLASQGGEQAYGPAEDWIEYRVPKTALGNPTGIALELFTTGGDGHAQDSVPSDPNVAYTDPDWSSEVTTLSAFALLPAPTWYVRGDFNEWGATHPMVDDGTQGDAAAGDGVYTVSISFDLADRYEFKVTTADWSTSYPSSGNSWLETTTASETVIITFDTNVHDDGWQPSINIIGVSTEPGVWTAVGDWQGWNNADPATAMTPLGGGVYAFTTAIATAGSYEYKAVKTSTWDAIGADGRSINAATASFETTQDAQSVTFTVDALAGRVNVEVESLPPRPALDDDVWWEGLGHNSRDDLYRVPWGAVTTRMSVVLRFRTFHGDLTDVTVRVWSTAAEAQTLYPMELVATTDEPPYGYDYWQTTIPAQDEPTILYYRFIVRDGSDEDFYEDDDLFDGGLGTAYDESPDYSFQIDVYERDFETPDWMKNAVVYQIFPDRFYNARRWNDARPWHPTVYENPVIKKRWGELPEGYCRAYEGVACDEQPLGRDFFGGDLRGVREKLGYLKELGVTAIYFNPIFMAPSNHLYDTTNYYRIDPYLGTYFDYLRLVYEARQKGIRVILDGVFNHTSSDSLYFDRYSRYHTEGAYESQDSPFYDWYTFYDWPDDYNSWWDFHSLPVLTEIEEVQDFVYGGDYSVARWWMKFGGSGWRLDVAPDKSHDWWEAFRPRVKSANPEAVILGEIWDDASPWILGDEFDTTMNYRFRRALIGFINGDTNDPNQGFIRGLDPDQFNSVLQSIKEDYPPPAFDTAMNLVGTHDTQRILWMLTPGARNRKEKEFDAANLAEGKEKMKLLAIVQMTLPGAPTIYYGDEVGMTGDTDPDDRRPFPWNSQDTDMLAHYRTLTGLRNEHVFLRTGSFDRLYTHNDDGTYAYGRKDTTGAAVVAVNRDTVVHDLTVDLSGYIPEGTVLTDELNDSTYTVMDGEITLTLAGRWAAILVTPPGVDLTPPQAPTGLAAAARDATVALTWEAGADAAGYYVYRSRVRGGGYERLNEVPLLGTAYADDTVENGRLYYYVVTAIDAAGNESGRSNEVEALPHLVIGWANLQWPPATVHTLSALDPSEPIYGQVWIDGHTDLTGPTDGLAAEVGFGPDGSDPAGNSDWTWVEATFNTDVGNNDEFQGQLLPEAVGTYDYAYRYTTTGGRAWVYADLDGMDNGYDPAQAGDLTVNASGDTTPPAAPTNLHVAEAAPSFIRLAWDPVADADLYRYDLYRSDTAGGPYAKIAEVLAGTAEVTDWDVTTGAAYYYVVLAVDTSFNPSGYSNEVEATAAARPVAVTFNVALPDTTPAGDDIYIGGSFNGWDPAGTLMTRTDLSATATVTLDEGTQIAYKYTRGSWTYVEKGAECEEIANRTATVTYGADGTMTLEDTVLDWRNTGPCGD
jgi:glycosidase